MVIALKPVQQDFTQCFAKSIVENLQANENSEIKVGSRASAQLSSR